MTPLDSFIEPWKSRLDASPEGLSPSEFPAYESRQKIDSLVTSCTPHAFELGTGASIYTHSLLPAILNAQHEVILVTCFWAKSSTLTVLKATLEQLAKQRQQQLTSARGPDSDIVKPLRIRICFSSRSLFQKIFHPSSKDGYIYPPSTWSAKLDLPSPEVLAAGAIDLQVKSIFFRPFSVMHPKFLIVDRQRAWLPSCNVSWEPWLECCVEITGDAVLGMLSFYRNTWERDPELSATANLEGGTRDDPTNDVPSAPRTLTAVGLTSIDSPARKVAAISHGRIPTILLPSSHHQNPKFRPFPWSKEPRPPGTPLNIGMLRLLEMAEKSIYLVTPNLTTAAVTEGVLRAVQRGVHVTIVTGKNMMVWEQILTAGSTTSRYLRSLIKRYNALREALNDGSGSNRSSIVSTSTPMLDLEAGVPRLGQLQIFYYHPRADNLAKGVLEEPVHSHVKLTIVDGQYTVLGSGNMDRASWFTSQELGILFHSPELAAAVRDTMDGELKERTEVVFGSPRS
ncbi:hypothetical protein BX600DRAFT_441003 [Xylariales sp. PMI_506]|nr:hypothetical protein BX600DRAFT_441003 [Xylariales sp. PMI_506]